MRVLLISDVYFPRINGVSASIQTLLRTLSKEDEACLIAPEYDTPWDDERHDVIRIRSHPTPGDHEDRIMYGKHIRRLHPQLAKRSFDAVHIHGFGIAFYEGVRIAKKLHLPVVLTYHTNFDEYLPHYVSFLPASVTRFGCRQAAIWQCNAVDAVVVPSHAMASALRSYGVRSQMHVIPTGLDLAQFRERDGSTFQKRYGISSTRQVLLFVGRVAPEKNVDFLIRMLANVVPRCPNVLLIVVGGGHHVEDCRELAFSLGLSRNVLFAGWLSRDTELLDCYAASDIFVFASKTETQGLALLEAMALGVPVVSISCLGSTDVLQQQRGAVVVSDNEHQFSTEVCKLLADRERRMALGTDGRKYAREWTSSIMVDELSKVFLETESSGDTSRKWLEREFWETLSLFLIAFYVLLETVQEWLYKC
jgi:1,2-diacylglycerol 3-alpha-glucosyltransferase